MVLSMSSRSDGSSKNYKILSEMLEDFDRMDVEELFRLVKERYSPTAPEGFDLMLWGEMQRKEVKSKILLKRKGLSPLKKKGLLKRLWKKRLVLKRKGKKLSMNQQQRGRSLFLEKQQERDKSLEVDHESS
ncbi:hypothetical protein Tco_1143867 [Tanacetum coccineum]